ncbi:chemotaxis protein CheW [Paenibacillus turpanensis]|uniref:chemotaxis protein CheW n=1 Tax=Paenibacillus turpanensis TaxID=2689078 RepID=UPI0014097780|nr:chemotaxis protein CheW [Paenibacillus turpanensis]
MIAAVEQLVTFRLEESEFGLPIQEVYEIIFVPKVTAVAKAPMAMIGVIHLRGSVIPIIDLRIALRMSAASGSRKQRIIITEARGSQLGLLVDEVTEVLRTQGGQMKEPPESIHTIDTRYMRAMFTIQERMLVLLDMDRVLDPRELEAVRSSVQ